MLRSVFVLAILLAGSAAATSSAQAPPERFAPSAVEEKAELLPEATNGLRAFIEEKFGRPGAPKAWDVLPVDFGQRDVSAGKAAGWKLEAGNRLFAKHCAACHGNSGAGAGPKAAMLEPRPRDFRRGWFKFRSTLVDERGMPGRPLRHDLRETLRFGLPGTAMPAFDTLQIGDINALVEYVRWLAIRGELEWLLVNRLEGAGDLADVERILAGEYKDDLELVVHSWLIAERESSIARPPKRLPANAASLAAGKKHFTDTNKTGCNKCHADDGKGWPQDRLPAEWRQQGAVWDLTSGKYRGGIDADDLFRRIRYGMIGSSMPQYPQQHLSDEDAWHVVNYTLSLMPEDMRKKQVTRRPPPKGLPDDSPLEVRTEAAPAPPAAKINWKGWGTLRGRFVYQGKPPATPAIAILRDRGICGDKVESDTFLIDKEGGLANVVVSLRTKGTPWKDIVEPRQEPAVLEVLKCRVVPHVLVVLAGEEFVLKNSDPIGHNVRAAPKNQAGFNQTLAANTKATVKLGAPFDKPVPVVSAIHPHIQGHLLACESPYFAVSGADGKFEIKQLPAGGPLDFQVWHERAPRDLTTGDWKDGRLQSHLQADELHDLGDIVITPEMVR
jgi:mono/diheme cytochrome c family protein